MASAFVLWPRFLDEKLTSGMYIIIAGLVTAFLITFFAIPSIIRIAHEKNLCDEPGERRSHSTSIPTLGGLAIFAGLIFSITFWIPFNIELYPSHRYIQYILCAFIIIFLIGAKDDIIPLSPSKKFAGQLLAAVILVVKAKIQLTSLYGILGIYDISEWLGIPLSIFTIIVIINSLNLIDGINGLSGSVGCLICAVFGYWFYTIGRLDLAVLGAALIGALLAFLYYNITPARIFMGDTGSLLIGLTASILAISFIEMNKIPTSTNWPIESVPAVAMGILIVPLYDTLRVFSMRIAKGRSPFSPDRTHIHHLLLDVGLSHMQSTSILVVVNICFVVLVYLAQGIGTLLLMLLVLGLATILVSFVQYLVYRKKNIAHA